MRGRDSELLLSTIFDDPPPVRPLPVGFRRGDDPAVQLIDGFVRGRASLGRFAVSPGLVGFRLAADARSVRVTVRLRADDVSATYWTDRVAERLGLAGDPSLPRLLQVRSQGRARGAVLLCRAPWAAAGTPVRGSLSFDLAPAELPADGLLLIELADAPGVSRGSTSAVLPRAAVGVEPTEVTVEPAGPSGPLPPGGTVDAVTAERRAWLATGDLPPTDGVGARTVRSGVFILDLPPAAGGAGTVLVGLTPRSPAPGSAVPPPRSAAAETAVMVTAASMIDGSAARVEVSGTGGGTQLRLTGAIAGPVRVHLTGGEPSGWNVTTVSRPTPHA